MKSAIFTDDSFGYSAIEEAIEYFSVAYKYDITAIISTVDIPWKEIRGIPVYTAGTLSECLDKAAENNQFVTVLDITSYCFADKFAFANVIINKGYALYGADYRIYPPRRNEVTSPGTGIPLPYEALSGHIELAQDGSAALRDWTLSGPLLSASLAGSLGASANLLSAPLDVTLQIRIDDDGARRALTPLGITPSADGSATLQVGGTLSAPTLE